MAQNNICDGYCDGDCDGDFCGPWPNMLPYPGGKFKITFTGGDTQYVYCHWTFGTTARLVKLNPQGYGPLFDSQFVDMAHVEELK